MSHNTTSGMFAIMFAFDSEIFLDNSNLRQKNVQEFLKNYYFLIQTFLIMESIKFKVNLIENVISHIKIMCTLYHLAIIPIFFHFQNDALFHSFNYTVGTYLCGRSF